MKLYVTSVHLVFTHSVVIFKMAYAGEEGNKMSEICLGNIIHFKAASFCWYFR